MEYSAVIRQGEELFSEGQIDKAEAVFDYIIKQQPDNHHALNNLGVINHCRGRRAVAEKYFLKAINLKNDYIDGCLNLAQMYIEDQKLAEACFYLEKCSKIKPDENIFKILYKLHSELGNFQRAQACLDNCKQSQFENTLGIKINQSEKQKYVHAQRRTNLQPLNILFVQDAPCIRNYKMATALRSRGHRVSLVYTDKLLSERYTGLSDSTYNECIKLNSYRHLWDISYNYDLIHCHNEPDTLTVAALAGHAPVIHDTHDLISLRAGGDHQLRYFEGIANRGAHGRIYTTPYQMEEARELYGVNGNSLVFYNYCSGSDLPKKLLPKLSEEDGQIHIVYEGGVGGSAHRDFSDLFIKLAYKDIEIHIYPAVFNIEQAHFFVQYPHIHYHRPVSPKNLIEEMSQYDFGIIPFNLKKGNKRFLDSTIANKLFEYLAAGLPVLASDLKSYRDYFSKYPIGMTFRDAEEITEVLPKLREMVTHLDWSTAFSTYEDKIGSLETFYRQILSRESRSEKLSINSPIITASVETENSQNVVYETEKAREYWKNHEMTAHYFHEGKQSKMVVKTIQQLMSTDEINSIFEFGCNVGRNLYCIKRKIPGCDIMGIDINETAIKAGRQHFRLPLRTGGEEALLGIPTNKYDVVFTVSVLDHIPEMEKVLKELLRICQRYFICIEPWNGENMDARKHAARKYSYFWDYPALFRKMQAKILQDIPCPLSEQGLGPYYRLYVIKPKELSDA